MTHEQIEEGEKRARDWKPHETTHEELLDAICLKYVVLKAIAGTSARRVAMINGRSFAEGDQGKVNAGEALHSVRCLEIKQNSVIISLEGINRPIEVALTPGRLPK